MSKCCIAVVFQLFITFFTTFTANAEPRTGGLLAGDYFAVVNGYEIPNKIFNEVVQAEARKRYYHGRITEERHKELVQEVGQRLIDNVLLMQEAERLGLVPDVSKIDGLISDVSESLRARGLKENQQALLNMREQFESRERIQMLEAKVRSGIVVSEILVRNYYEQNVQLFTVPQEWKVSLILIQVSPSAPTKEWVEAEGLLHGLRLKIKNEASFTELAKKYSDDVTAKSGGDMGYLHKGMLHDDIESALEGLDNGAVSQPVRVLEGYVLVRLDEIKSPLLKSYEQVKLKAHEMFSMYLSDKTWHLFIKKLRDKSSIVLNKNLPELMLK